MPASLFGMPAKADHRVRVRGAGLISGAHMRVPADVSSALSLLAYLLARYALDLSAHDVLAVTLCAALPTAQNVFIYASEYALDTAFARNAVILSTIVSMASLWTVVALLK